MSANVRGNFVLTDGKAIPCESRVHAVQVAELLATGGFHLTDEEDTMPESNGFSYGEPREDFTDHIGMMSVMEQDADEYLSLLEGMLNARTQKERNAILELCKEGSYPSVPELAIAALVHVGNGERARKLVNQISRKMPDVFRGMQDILSA